METYIFLFFTRVRLPFLNRIQVKILSYVLAFLVIALPVCATTIFAIRNHAEFDISAQRSLTMYAALSKPLQILENNQTTMTANQIAAEIYQIATITTHENSDWLEIFKMKQAEC